MLPHHDEGRVCHIKSVIQYDMRKDWKFTCSCVVLVKIWLKSMTLIYIEHCSFHATFSMLELVNRDKVESFVPCRLSN
jgi:hypothetical protein